MAAAQANKLFVKRWLSDPAAYPIIGVISGAVLLCSGASLRYLFKSPDVQWNKGDRQNCMRENEDEGIRFANHRPSIAYMKANPVNTNNDMVRQSRILSRRNTKADYAKSKAESLA